MWTLYILLASIAILAPATAQTRDEYAERQQLYYKILGLDRDPSKQGSDTAPATPFPALVFAPRLRGSDDNGNKKASGSALDTPISGSSSNQAQQSSSLSSKDNDDDSKIFPWIIPPPVPASARQQVRGDIPLSPANTADKAQPPVTTAATEPPTTTKNATSSPGKCPTSFGPYRYCFNRCTDKMDCEDGELCCWNGCAKICTAADKS